MKETRAKAEGGDGEAMWRLGAWYQYGDNGLAKDEAQARAWYERSAAARDPRGMARFGECLLCGQGGPQNNALGLVNVTEAAHLGSDIGAYFLGTRSSKAIAACRRTPSGAVLAEEGRRRRVRAQALKAQA